MKPFLLLALVTVVAFTGCRKQERTSIATEELKLFEKGKGLRLPEQTCQVIGVETVEVAEKPFRIKVEVFAQVYESGGEKPTRAVATLPTGHAKAFQPGAPVTFFVSAGDSNRITGTLTQIENLGSSAEALLELPDPDRRFAVGSFLRAVFAADEAHNALAVPEGSVIHGAEGPFVYAVNGAHYTRTPVEIGGTSDGFTEILDGLYGGDLVAGKASERMWMIELYALKGGTPCCPVPEKKTAVN